jgi:hypothetical protein
MVKDGRCWQEVVKNGTKYKLGIIFALLSLQLGAILLFARKAG